MFADIPNKNIRALALKAKLDAPMAILAVLWIVVIVTGLILEENNPMRNSLEGLDWVIWFLFLAEYVILVSLAGEKVRYVRNNIFDLVVVLLPALRILRVANALLLFKGATVVSETTRETLLFVRWKRAYYLVFLFVMLASVVGVLGYLFLS